MKHEPRDDRFGRSTLKMLKVGISELLSTSFTNLALGSVSIKVLNTLLSLAVTVVLARVLGPREYGIYAFSLSVIMILSVLARAGLPTLMVRELAIYKHSSDWGLINGLIRVSNRAALTITICVVFLAGTITVVIGNPPPVFDRGTMLVALALVPVLTGIALRSASIRGLGSVLTGQVPDQLVRPGILLLALTFLFLFGMPRQLHAGTAMTLHLVSACCALLFAVFFLRRLRTPQTRRVAATNDGRNWLRSAFPFAIVAGTQIVINQTDIVMLGFFLSPAEVGLYRVAVQGAMIVAFSLSAINMALAPSVARLYVAQKSEQLQNLITRSTRLISVLALPAAVAFIFFGGAFLNLVFGSAYGPGATALAILSVGQVINAMIGSVGIVLTMTGHAAHVARGVSLGALLNIGLNWILIPKYGLNGAAVASLVSMAIWNGFLAYACHVNLGISTTVFGGNTDRPLT